MKPYAEISRSGKPGPEITVQLSYIEQNVKIAAWTIIRLKLSCISVSFREQHFFA
jgi:hypothetical protein